MDVQAILKALQEGKISVEDAKKQLLLKKNTKNDLNKKVRSQSIDYNKDNYYGLVLSTVHSLEEISLQEWHVPQPGHDEVTIEVKASAINFPDIMCIRGLYPTMPEYPFVPGFEVSGVVTCVGKNVSDIHIGDLVIGVTGKQMGGHARLVNVPEAHVVRKPDNITFEEACSLPVAFGTVFYAYELARLSHGEHVLIQTATGGLGLVAIQLAQHKGCTIYGTSSKQEKLDILKRIGVHHVINYKTQEFDKEIRRLTGNKGIDVLLNMLSGDSIQKGLNCLAPSGRYMELAVHALRTSPKLDLTKLVNNQSIHSIDLRRMSFQQSFFGKDLLNKMVSYIETGELMPIVSMVYPVNRIKEAMEYVASGKHIGKVVISHTCQTVADYRENLINGMVKHQKDCLSAKPLLKKVYAVPKVKHEEQKPEGIAVIGMAGQFPKAKNLDEFWDNIGNSRDCISEVDEMRWSLYKYYDPDFKAPGKTYSKWLGILEDADKFDPLFFSISPKEAELMDPQQRLFLESCWHCIEDAGISASSLSGSRCGVFVGCSTGDYEQRMSGQELNAQGLMGKATSILSARISYLLNLKGPCIAIDTACSSSLVAISEACSNLLSGACDMALAGGVSVLTGPSMHIMASKGEMLSKDGRCFTFDSRANGFVPGEGVGVILLKRLSDAVRDRDPICGVIRGWGINQDGKTNGITAPSVNSQILLEREVYQRFGINPERISLIEAHGTGTKLGDPIEVEALTESFRSYTRKKNYCALGSVKSNIGHPLAAAGVAGVLKVLMAFRHRMLPPTINFEKINPHIQLEDSPFYVNTKLKKWDLEQGVPMCAAVSAFGFSGTNAHIVIEEYIEKNELAGTKSKPSNDSPVVFVLSAKSDHSLKVYAERMKKHIEEHRDIDMEDLAYTLQTGREPMDYRMAVAANSREHLLKALEGYLKDETAENVFCGKAKKGRTDTKSFDKDRDLQSSINTWIEKRELIELAKAWVDGLKVDWRLLYNNEPGRLRLPVYPFNRESYWVYRSDDAVHEETAMYKHTKVHPLLHENTSDLTQQRFSSTFSGKEFFVSDHVVRGHRVLPGAAHLEMVRAALEKSAGDLETASKRIRIKNVVWARPIIVGDQPVTVHTALYPEASGDFAFEIYGGCAENPEDQLLYSQGCLSFDFCSEEAPNININSLIEECPDSALTPEQCYHIFKTGGLDYGPAFRGIDKLYTGNGKVFVKLSLPSCVLSSIDQYRLHPSVIDSALQGSIGLMSDSSGVLHYSRPYLPFAMEEAYIWDKCTASMWAVIGNRRVEEGSRVQKLDIDICDDAGKVCIRIKGFTSRLLEDEGQDSAYSTESGTLIAHPCWMEKDVEEKVSHSYNSHTVILCEQNDTVSRLIKESIENVKCINLQSEETEIDKRFSTYAVQIFKEIQALLKSSPNARNLVQVVISGQEERSAFRGLSGILKTARLENSSFTGQLIDIENNDDIVKKLKENSLYSGFLQIRYRDGKRWVMGWNEINNHKESRIPWKDGGTYLVTGGTGGLGLIIAKEIGRAVKDPTIVLIGRSPIGKDMKMKLAELEESGARVEYHQTDITDLRQTEELLQSMLEDYGSPNGIIHCAGVVKDNLIINKTEEQFKEVLAPKVCGLVNIDTASRDIPVDFFIVFSSVAGSFGNYGQVDYSTANAFMDAYVEYRQGLVEAKQRSGQTISINWPLWKEGGMAIDPETERMVRMNMGIVPMETASGIEALYRVFGSGMVQTAVLEGNIEKIKKKLLAGKDEESKKGNSLTDSYESEKELQVKVQKLLMQAMAMLLKVKIEDIDIYTELSEYGFDSIGFTEFANYLNEVYELELTPTLFFEHKTVADLAEFFASEHPKEFENKITVNKNSVAPKQTENSQSQQRPKNIRRAARFPKEFGLSPTERQGVGAEPIAIIGISGKFPMADNPDDFWHNLVNEKDCITEIPQERWDWKKFYGDPKTEENKTNIKWGGFIEGVDEFDPMFFGISPKEAQLMDPQQRLLMTYVWKVIEDAGYSAESISDTKTALFIGTGNSSYSKLIYKSDLAGDFYNTTGMVPSVGPNRMSYFLNIHGPSEPVETACSSSLVAVHRAVMSLENDHCQMAIAGGINTILTPDLHISFSKAGMLSQDGRCKTFSNKANGYVRGEGVGMILLKKLRDAEESGDHIYGVIRGTAVNHGGRANSFTAPNPRAQADVLVQAYKKAGTDPRTITYIEAHGTGTELGDPIEINGLKMAFEELYKDTGEMKVQHPHCGLGSVKTNIGHLELAAGAAGLIKVLLQMKYKTLVKSLHCEEINPYIKLEDSPFYILQETKEWEALRDSQGNPVPRRAGVSSFGFGGVNAHVVVEEYVPGNKVALPSGIRPQMPAVIVLSAKSGEILREQAKQLLEAIRKGQVNDDCLMDAAYTLQVGRDAFEERFGVVVSSVDELERKLEGFLNQEAPLTDIYTGTVNSNKETMAVFTADEELKEAVEKWVQRGKYGKILELWVKGLKFDWNRLYGSFRPHRMSLPTYQFAKERYWIDDAALKTGVRRLNIPHTAYIHPLLKENTSDLSEQRFSSYFTGEEFFLSHHVVKGKKVFPGTAYLEMARAAVEKSAGAISRGKEVMKLKNIVWSKPIELEDQAVSVHIRLFAVEDDEVSYQIYTGACDDSGDQAIHSQGTAAFEENFELPPLDILELMARCNKLEITSEQCYKHFKNSGLDYGPGHQCIEKIFVGQGQAVAKLYIPEAVKEDWQQYVLHPGLMDSAIQAAVGLTVDTELQVFQKILAVPYALEEVEIFSGCTSEMWAWVRLGENKSYDNIVSTVDIDICDNYGKVCIRMKGLTLKEIGGEAVFSEESQDTITLLLSPYWEEQSVPPETGEDSFQEHMVVLCELDGISGESIEKHFNGTRCITVKSGDMEVEQRFSDFVVRVFEEIQSLFNNKTKRSVMVQVVISGWMDKLLFSGISGLLKTACKENPMMTGQLIILEERETTQSIIEKLAENKFCTDACEILYRGGKRHVLKWGDIDCPVEAPVPWKDKGVYIITGGMGGLGTILAKDIVNRVKDPVLVLTGRSAVDDVKKAQIKELELKGAYVDYRQADIDSKETVEDLIKSILRDHGRINGIIHCAGMIQDNYILKKTEQEIRKVLMPKVNGLMYLDNAARELELEFFIFFSSTAGTLGNIGQSDYSAANAFMDAFAEYRNGLVKLKQRQGKTLSINWPLWKEGGIHPPEETMVMMHQIGVSPMESDVGIKCLYRSMASGKDRVMILHGEEEKVLEFVGNCKMRTQYTGNTQLDKKSKHNMHEIFEKIVSDQLSLEEFAKLIHTF